MNRTVSPRRPRAMRRAPWSFGALLALGFLLLDDGFIARVIPARWRPERNEGVATAAAPDR